MIRPASPLTACLLFSVLLLVGCTLLDVDEGGVAVEAAAIVPPEPDFPELGLNRSEEVQTGIMSWYSVKTNRGTATASGEKFRDDGDTAAHRTLPFGTYVEVVNISNNKSAVLRINDRGPFTKGRIIDVSIGAAKKLDFVGRGITQCEVRVLVPVDAEEEEEVGEEQTVASAPGTLVNEKVPEEGEKVEADAEGDEEAIEPQPVESEGTATAPPNLSSVLESMSRRLAGHVEQ